MNSASVDVKDMILADSSLPYTLGTDLFIGREPAKPDKAVMIFDSPGGAPAVSLGGETFWANTMFQIRVRDTSYLDGWEKINDIVKSIHGRAQQVWNGSLYSSIVVFSGPALMGYDESNRVNFVVNFLTLRREEPNE